MTADDVSSSEMQRLLHAMGREHLHLDDGTAERLVGGTLAPDDAPPAYRRVAQTVLVATLPGTDAELAGEVGAVASIAAQLDRSDESAPRRSAVNPKPQVLRLATASVVGGIFVLGGLAGAGALPGAAQGVAADMLDIVGVTVPGADDHADTHPDVRGRSEDAPPAESPSVESPSAPSGHGDAVSDLARTTTATGVEKGAEISSLASDGQSQAGQHGPASETDASADRPNKNGSAPGAATAATQSNGHSADGQANAQSHKP